MPINKSELNCMKLRHKYANSGRPLQCKGSQNFPKNVLRRGSLRCPVYRWMAQRLNRKIDLIARVLGEREIKPCFIVCAVL
uniref:Uncharacterized protein n=1 Tax=Anguilla anguilla TaxID=7936 RepID=A0A0E9XBM7_ANGAN